MIESQGRGPKPTLIVRAVGDRQAIEAIADARGPNIHVWRASLRDPPTGVSELRRTLSSDERARVDKLRSSRDRRRWSVGRGVLRLVLAAYTGDRPERLSFGYGSTGKPSLADHGARTGGSSLHFNLSHSEDLLLIAVSRGAPVGIDVERIRTIAGMEDIARRWLPLDEYRAIRRAPTPTLRAELFCTAWTCAEASAKAGGEGLWKTGRARRGAAPVVFRPQTGFVAAVASGPTSTPAAA